MVNHLDEDDHNLDGFAVNPMMIDQWVPIGFADIPTSAIDPPPPTASPALPALIGSRSPSWLTRLNQLQA